MKNKLKIFRNIINYLLFFIVILIIFSTLWALRSYDNIQPEEILFYLSVPIDSTESGIIKDYLLTALLPAFLLSVIALYFIRELLKKLKKHIIIIYLTIFKKDFKIKVKGKVISIIINILLALTACLACYYCAKHLNLTNYISSQMVESTFIEDNYVDTKTVKLEFPKKKKNLIYIYVESLETTFFEESVGGSQKEELMPELRELIKDSINFSNTDKIGGAIQVSNLSWTTAGMISTTSGLPLKIAPEITNEGDFKSLLSGAYTLGDILKDEGYNQMIMVGSDSTFGNRDIYFKGHGNYKIYDYETAKELKKIADDYYVWWGFEDSKLFSYAKEEITKMSKEDKPFNFTLLTANTHSSDGYLETNCESKFQEKYANSIACSTKQVVEFVNWIKKQSFYQDTTIVITGDHLSMDTDFFKNISPDYTRTVLNMFINSSEKSNNTKNRLYTTMDLFPTTLVSLGVNIPNNRLGLGTNLFSDEKTILEKYGEEKVNEEIQLKSNFYNQKILANK